MTEAWGLSVVEDDTAVAVYEDESGQPAFLADDPFIMSDGISLQAPIAVQVVDGPIYIDALGNAGAAIPVAIAEGD